jgi:hypothetical protein
MTRRDVLRLAAPFAATPVASFGSACLSALDARTIADYDAYLKNARTAGEQPIAGKMLSRVPQDERPALQKTLEEKRWCVWNLQAAQPHGALPVYKGIVVDWMGAMLLPGVTVKDFQKVLEGYGAYKSVYKPYVFDCYARPVQGPGFKNYSVTSILHDILEKPAPLVPDQHFSFEVMAESNYFWLGPEDNRTLVIRTHANTIREVNGGRPERADSRVENDLLPVGHGQGLLWKSDTWWRAAQMGPNLYAEYESVSLARSLDAVEFFSLCSVLKLPGVKGKAFENMVARPRKTVTDVVMNTKRACEEAARPT